MLNIKDAIANFGNMTMATVSEESIIFEYKQASERKNKRGEVTSYAVKGDAVPESISINWCIDNNGSQCLHLKKKTELVASFNLHTDGSMEWLPISTFGIRGVLIAKPLDPNNDVIVSYSLYNFFEQWVLSSAFSVGLNQLAAELIYPPAVVKLLLLFLAYMTERTRQAELLKKLSSEADISVDKDRIAVMFHDFMERLIGDTKRMKRLYSDTADFIALPPNRDEILALVAGEVNQPEPIAEVEIIDPDNTEDDQEIISLPEKTEETPEANPIEVTATEEIVETTPMEDVPQVTENSTVEPDITPTNPAIEVFSDTLTTEETAE